MRPTRLEVKGFTAFREKCEIDFTGFDLFAITGPTGAGKTSLLDAMTYALYGRTSRLNKAGRDLISQGAQAMSVLLEFRVGAQEYRVLRAIKGANVSARFERRQNGAWTPGVGSIGEVNDEILRVVGLDFGGFTKTVILPQGKFDVFLRGEPKERREVLADLLEVDVYQRMMKSANEKSKDAGIRAEERAAQIDGSASPEALGELEQRLGELVRLEGEGAARAAELERVYPDAVAIREKRHSLARGRRDLDEMARQAGEAGKSAGRAAQQVETHSAALGKVQRQMEATAYDADEHLRLMSWLPQARQRRKLEEQVVRARKEVEKHGRELTAAEKAFETARGMAEAARSRAVEASEARAAAEAAYKAMRLRHGSADAIQQIVRDLEGARRDAGGAAELEEQVKELEDRATSLESEMTAGAAAVERAEGDLREAEKFYEQLHTLDRAAALRHELKPGEPCPVCEQVVETVPPVPDSGLLAKGQNRVKQSRAAVAKQQERVSVLRAEAQALPGRLELARVQLQARQARVEQATSRARLALGSPVEDPMAPLRGLVKDSKAAEQDAQEAREAADEALKQQAEHEGFLHQGESRMQLASSAAGALRMQIQSWGREIADLEDVLRGAPAVPEIEGRVNALEMARKRRAELEGQRKQHELALKQAEEGVREARERGRALASERQRGEERMAALEAEVAQQLDELRRAVPGLDLPGSGDEAAQIQRLLEASRRDWQSAQAGAQKCRFGIDDLVRRLERNRKLGEEVRDLRRESAVYRDLGTWLNAGNFQQYLLGSAFEALAREGSRHLKELSAGRYEFAFEDDEFVVNDHFHAGESRSARTLSGGESFLASLALALALAESITQLHGERGARNLESLFLDEGFSTLDSETLSKVSDAIQVLQNGRRLIGIVTHVESLADQLPVRIDIEKTASGSRIARSATSATLAEG